MNLHLNYCLSITLYIFQLFLINFNLIGAETPICIVGGGISGLSLGNHLQGKGHEVVVFEKFEKVGGKIITFRTPKVQADTGPLYFAPFQHNIIKTLEEYKLTVVKLNETDVWGFDRNSGILVPPRLLLNFRPYRHVIIKAAQKYGQIRSEYLRKGLLGVGYLNVTPEMSAPISIWLEKNRLRVLKPILRAIMTVEGFGAIEDTPMIYILQWMPAEMITDVILNPRGGFLTVYEGFDILAQKMAQSLHVKLNEEVIKIVRGSSNLNSSSSEIQSLLRLVTSRSSPSSPRRNGKMKGQGQMNFESEYECSKVILAFPPLLSQVEHMIPDLSQEERVVLGEVKNHKMAVGVHIIPNWVSSLYGDVRVFLDPLVPSRWLAGNGEVVGFARQSYSKLGNVYTSYSWMRGDFRDVPNEEDLEIMEEKLNETIGRVAGGGGKFKTLMRIQQKHPYFPHVNSESIGGGFYEKFEGMQGRGGIYWATTLLSFECTDSALKMTEAFVQKYF